MFARQPREKPDGANHDATHIDGSEEKQTRKREVMEYLLG